MVRLGDLMLLGGAGVVGYKYYKGEWPWQADWFPWAGPAPAPGGEINVTSVSVPSSATVGDTFTVTATVENTGEESGSRTVVFTLNGEEIDRGSTGSIPPGTSVDVKKDYSIDFAGDYSFCAEIAEAG